MNRKPLSRKETDQRREQFCHDWEIWGEPISVHVSGGNASAICWKLCIERYGPDRVVPVFADTNSESDDTYRFLDECEKAFGQDLIRLSQFNDDGSKADIWDLFDRRGVARLQKSGACIASIELKQKPLDRWTEENGINAVAFGLCPWTEIERCVRRDNKEYTPIFPLISRKPLGYCGQVQLLESWGITPAEAYDHGAPHNNCLKHGCILQGISQWAEFLKQYPDRYAETEKRSQAFFERTGFSLLRDRRGGTLKPYTLTELRQDIERGRKLPDGWRSNCSCMEPQQMEMF